MKGSPCLYVTHAPQWSRKGKWWNENAGEKKTCPGYRFLERPESNFIGKERSIYINNQGGEENQTKWPRHDANVMWLERLIYRRSATVTAAHTFLWKVVATGNNIRREWSVFARPPWPASFVVYVFPPDTLVSLHSFSFFSFASSFSSHMKLGHSYPQATLLSPLPKKRRHFLLPKPMTYYHRYTNGTPHSRTPFPNTTRVYPFQKAQVLNSYISLIKRGAQGGGILCSRSLWMPS